MILFILGVITILGIILFITFKGKKIVDLLPLILFVVGVILIFVGNKKDLSGVMFIGLGLCAWPVFGFFIWLKKREQENVIKRGVERTLEERDKQMR